MAEHLHIAIAALSPDQLIKGQALAERLCLPLIDANSEAAKNYDYILLLTADYLGLVHRHDKKQQPFYLDLLTGKLGYRSHHATMRNELLVRAMGLKQSAHPFIVDATAGLLRDSFILATLGFQVTALERSPIIHALAEDALKRAEASLTTKEAAKRIQLVCTDAVEWLQETRSNNGQKPDIIYLDPMFPARKKSASVKKEMVMLHNLLGSSKNENILLSTALTCATNRVVVKRPRLAETLTEDKPSFSLSGKSSRFDVYLTKK